MFRSTVIFLLGVISNYPLCAMAADVEQEETEITESRSDREAEDDAEVVSKTEIERRRIETGEEKREERGAREDDDSGVVQERTVITEKAPPEKGGLTEQTVAIVPQAGFLSLDDTAGDGNTRAVFGITVDGNLLADVPTEPGKPFLGPSVGIFYSHIGQPGANFLGLNAPGGDEGADLVMIPLNLKAGYTFNEAVRISAHGGVSVNFQNNSSDVDITTDGGTTTTETTFRDEDWDVNSNIGFDVEFGLGKRVLMLVRPDWTFLPGNDAFTGTLGIGFPLGS